MFLFNEKRMDKMMDQTIKNAKKMQRKMLDMQEEVYNENGEQIERVNKRAAELGASGTKIKYEAAAKGIKEGMKDEPKKFCCECGEELSASAKFCSECGTKQK